MSNKKSDFPPCFKKLGLHRTHFCELRPMCVDGFPLSFTRERIMHGLESFVVMLERRKIEGVLWVDGSFLTTKIDPDDVDVLLRVKFEFYTQARKEQREFIDWLSQTELKETDFMCDQYVFVDYPETHRRHAHGEELRMDWSRLFTTSHDKTSRKGLARIQIPRRTTPPSQRFSQDAVMMTSGASQFAASRQWGRS